MTSAHEKHFAFLQLLIHGTVKLSVNTTKVGVILPLHLYDKPYTTVEIGLNMAPLPIEDLDIGEDGIRATLSFNRTPAACHIPWYAVFQILSEQLNKAYVWQYDVPVVDEEPDQQLGSTGSDDVTPSHTHRNAYIDQLKPAPKPKRQLPPGWGGLVRDSDVVPIPDEKEPA